MTNAYYIQTAQHIIPIFGVSTIEEAKEYVVYEDFARIVETSDEVYMNAETGSVDFASNWESEGVDLDDLVLVTYSTEGGGWVEA